MCFYFECTARYNSHLKRGKRLTELIFGSVGYGLLIPLCVCFHLSTGMVNRFQIYIVRNVFYNLIFKSQRMPTVWTSPH